MENKYKETLKVGDKVLIPLTSDDYNNPQIPAIIEKEDKNFCWCRVNPNCLVPIPTIHIKLC
jgi:hypothetical protein